eukprot:m.1074894 g.1074894  ORF g.1074894 m.1074894 type:complete len:1016 (-) comp24238_c0_seq68:1890-4937(-)
MLRAMWYNINNMVLLLVNLSPVHSACMHSADVVGSIAIPDTVTILADGAYQGCNDVTSVFIPDSVTSIGQSAFKNCASLANVSIPDSVTTIGAGAFPACIGFGLRMHSPELIFGDNDPYGISSVPRGVVECIPCQNVSTLTFPAGLVSINSFAFQECNAIQNIVFPDTLVSIGIAAFNECSRLQTVVIPDAVEIVSDYAFDNCRALQSVKIGNAVTHIGIDAFESCIGFGLSTTSDAAATTTPPDAHRGTTVECAPCAHDTVLRVPNATATIGEFTFIGCNSITTVAFPDTLQRIGNAAFSSSASLQTVTIPDAVTYIGLNAFGSCGALEHVALGDSVFFIGALAFSQCLSLFTIVLPDAITAIEVLTFMGCRDLVSVTFGQGLTSIGEGAFQSCDSLSSIQIPNSVQTIGETAFYGCSLCGIDQTEQIYSVLNDAVEFVGLHLAVENVTVLAGYTFYHCDTLQSVRIADTVVRIAPRAVSFAVSLNAITIPDSVTMIASSAFEGCVSLHTVRIPPRVNVSAFAFFGCACDIHAYTNGTALQECKPGYLNATDDWVQYTTCAPGAEYQTRAGSYTSDRACASLTVCSATTQRVATPATATTDRVCATNTQRMSPAPLSTAKKVAITIGAVVVTTCACIVIVYLQQKRRRTESDLHLRDLLLEDERAEKQHLYAENIEMKRAWEIDERDLKMERQLAAGAFGSVWRAQWGHVVVAVKLLKTVLPEDALDSLASDEFDREVSFMQKIRHPNLVLFYGAGRTAAHVPFLVVEFMSEGSMRKVLASVRVLSCATRVGMALDIARGMRHLHGIGSLHRDLKSDNCLVGDNLRTKVADFGTSRLIKGGNMTNNTASWQGMDVEAGAPFDLNTHGVGTPLWMAPEMMRRGGAYGQAVDIYSYGIVLWELLTRETPWEKEILETGAHFSPALWNAVQGGVRPTLPAVTEFADAYVKLLTQCWQGEPSARPAFADIVTTLETLEEHPDVRPVPASQPPVYARASFVPAPRGSAWRRRQVSIFRA